MSTGCLFVADYAAWTFHLAGRSQRHLVVLSKSQVVGASRAARQQGINPGMAAERARSLLPQATFVARDPELETAAWEEVLQTVYRYTLRIESVRPGLLYLAPRQQDDLRALADRLHVRGGLAGDRGTARLAAHRAAPGRVLHVRPEQRIAFLKRYPTSRLTSLGFAEPFVERLELFGYRMLGQVRTLRRRHLADQFGEEGERLHALLHPKEEAPVPHYQAPPILQASWDFETTVTTGPQVLRALEQTTREVVDQLDDRRAGRLVVMLQLRCGRTLRRTHLLREPAAAYDPLLRLARRLLDTLLEEDDTTSSLDTLHAELGRLQNPEVRQGMLFARRPGLKKAVQAVHRRYPGVLARFTLHPDALFPEERQALVEYVGSAA